MARIHLVCAAFGPTRPGAEAAYEAIDRALARHHGDLPRHWAWTAASARQRLGAAGRPASDPAAAIAACAAAGAEAIIVQSVHVASGGQDALVHQAVAASPVPAFAGAPLLADEAGLEAVATAVAAALVDDRPNLLVAHGSERRPTVIAPYQRLAEYLAAHGRAIPLASLEGPPGTEVFAHLAAQVSAAGGIHFLPLLLAEGHHVVDDLLGTGPDSWRHRLAAGRASVAPPLGCLPAVHDLLARRVAAARARL